MSNIKPECKTVSPRYALYTNADVRSPATPSGLGTSFELFEYLAARHEGVMGGRGLQAGLEALLGRRGRDDSSSADPGGRAVINCRLKTAV